MEKCPLHRLSVGRIQPYHGGENVTLTNCIDHWRHTAGFAKWPRPWKNSTGQKDTAQVTSSNLPQATSVGTLVEIEYAVSVWR